MLNQHKNIKILINLCLDDRHRQHSYSLVPSPHLQARTETLLEDIQVSGIENKLQRLLPVGQGEGGTECVHQQAADLHPEGVAARPQDAPPLLVRCSTSTGAALQGGIEVKQSQGSD